MARISCRQLHSTQTYTMTPKRLILTDGFRLDQIYTSENASDEARKGMVMKCATAWDQLLTLQEAYEEERADEEEEPDIVCSPI